MNIVIPAAGMGSRFATKGYTLPKAFLPIKGKPMVEWVIDNFASPGDKVYVLLRTQDMVHLQGSSLAYKPGVAFLAIDRPTEGAACTILTARPFIDNNEKLLLVNSDQWVKYDREKWLRLIDTTPGVIMTFPNDDPKWSYAELDEYGRVLRVAEKEVISNHATVGAYAFQRGTEFCSAADRMIEKNIRTRGEFYLCPVFNELVPAVTIKTFEVELMLGLGTPADFEFNQQMVGV